METILDRLKPVQTGFPIQGKKGPAIIGRTFQACSNRIPYSGLKAEVLTVNQFQACSNRIPYSGSSTETERGYSFKPVQTGFPIQVSARLRIWSKRFKPVQTGFPIQASSARARTRSFQACSNRIPYSGTKGIIMSFIQVSSLFKQDSLFRSVGRLVTMKVCFKPVQTGFPIQVFRKPAESGNPFQACSNRIPYSGVVVKKALCNRDFRRAFPPTSMTKTSLARYPQGLAKDATQPWPVVIPARCAADDFSVHGRSNEARSGRDARLPGPCERQLVAAAHAANDARESCTGTPMVKPGGFCFTTG